jgi:NAD+ kinase
MPKFSRVGLIAKPHDLRIRDALRTLVPYLKARGIEVYADRSCAELLDEPERRLVEVQDRNTHDLVIAIGGDGTLLRAAHLISSYEVRLLGINIGHLGFLADISPEEIPECLDPILDGHYLEEHRMVLQCHAWRDGLTLCQRDAINDVVVQKWNVARLIALETYVNDRLVQSQRSDGVIVTTPTGSTAYALSCGGPILHPALNALAIVPLCPHSLSNRPIVLSGESCVEIVVGPREIDLAVLICDGEIGCELAPGDRVRVQKSDRYVRLIHPAGHDHFATLRAKLQWG